MKKKGGSIASENYLYKNGHVCEIKLNGSTSIFKPNSQNSLGLVTSVSTGPIGRTYSYNSYGIPTGRSASNIMNESYSFSASTGNLISRKDNRRNKTESFRYDGLNRLTGYGSQTASYDSKGNLTKKSDTGTFSYSNSSKPYALSGATVNTSAIPLRNQQIAYNSFQQPNSIAENNNTAYFRYNTEGQRVKMHLNRSNKTTFVRHYLGNCYEKDIDNGNVKEKLYLGGDYYSAPAVYVKQGSGSWQLYYICRDYLGSIVALADSRGSLKQELSYDAWGRVRNPSNQISYAPDKEPVLFLGRGYTGHEHLPCFGLINMNGRLYDPAVGRFLSPDNYVQLPDFTQNFNRYSYCLNNPLKYNDPDGEFIFTLAALIAAPFTGGASLALLPYTIGADLGAWQGGTVANGTANPLKWDYSSGKTWGYMAGGAIVGATSGGAANAVATSGMTFANTTAIMTGSYINSVGMAMVTGGQTDVSIGFGFASYNISKNSWGYLGKKGNKWYENVGYGLGAIANVGDILAGFNPGEVQLNTENSDAIGHSALTKVGETNPHNSLVSVGPDPGGKWIFNPFKFKNGTNDWENYVNAGSDVSKVTVKGINLKRITSYGARLDKGVNYNLYASSCVNHTARALTLAGAPAIGLHPFILHSQMYMRSIGARPSMFSYYIY